MKLKAQLIKPSITYYNPIEIQEMYEANEIEKKEEKKEGKKDAGKPKLSNWDKLKMEMEAKVQNLRKKGKKKGTAKEEEPKEEPKVVYKPLNVKKENISRELTNLLLGDRKTSEKQVVEAGTVLSIDCEMVGVGTEGKEHALARVSIINFYGTVIYDTYVKSHAKVTDYRTFVSGITAAHLRGAPEFKIVQSKVKELLKDRIVVGHDLRNDFDVLGLTHPRELTRDTSTYYPLLKANNGRKPSLKNLAKNLLGFWIQGESHSSIEDAMATMAIYRKFRAYWEDRIKDKQRHSKVTIKEKKSRPTFEKNNNSAKTESSSVASKKQGEDKDSSAKGIKRKPSSQLIGRTHKSKKG